jgi:hypothetical protein
MLIQQNNWMVGIGHLFILKVINPVSEKAQVTAVLEGKVKVKVKQSHYRPGRP